MGGQKYLRWNCRLTAPGRHLEAVSFHSSRGTAAASDGRQQESLLLLDQKSPLNSAEPLLLGDEPRELSILTPEQSHSSQGLVPFQMEFHFLEGPPFRCWPQL